MLSQQLLRRTPFLVTVAALLLLLPICLARRKSPVARSSPACATSSEVAAAASGQQARLSAADTPAESLSRASSVISTTSATSVSKSPTNVDNAGPITGTASTAGTLSATSTTSFARVPSAPSQASSSAQSASVETIINESVVVYDSYLSGHTVYSTAKVFSSVTETVSASGEVITATSLQRVTIPTVSSPLSRQTSSSTGTRTTFAPSQSGTSIEPKPATPNRNTLRIAAALALGSLCILVLGFSLWCWRRRRKRAVLGDAADDSGVFVPYRIVPYTKARSLLADTNRAPSPVTENDIEEELEGVRVSVAPEDHDTEVDDYDADATVLTTQVDDSRGPLRSVGRAPAPHGRRASVSPPPSFQTDISSLDFRTSFTRHVDSGLRFNPDFDSRRSLVDLPPAYTMD